MVKFNPQTNKFESTYKSFDIGMLTPNIVYGWIKQGEMPLVDFKHYLNFLIKEQQ